MANEMCRQTKRRQVACTSSSQLPNSGGMKEFDIFSVLMDCDGHTTFPSEQKGTAVRSDFCTASEGRDGSSEDMLLAQLVARLAPVSPLETTLQVLSTATSSESDMSSLAQEISPIPSSPGRRGGQLASWPSAAAAPAWSMPCSTIIANAVAQSAPAIIVGEAALQGAHGRAIPDVALALNGELSQHDASYQLLVQKLQDVLSLWAALEATSVRPPDTGQQGLMVDTGVGIDPMLVSDTGAGPCGPAMEEGAEGALGPVESQIAECIREARDARCGAGPLRELHRPRQVGAKRAHRLDAPARVDAFGELWRSIAKERIVIAHRKWEINMGEIVLQDRIAVGGYSEVFRAAWHGTPVAVKRLTHTVASLPEVLEQFDAEVAMLSSIRHPNLILFMGFCNRPPTYSIITEYMHRGSLCRILAQSGPLEVARQFSVAVAIARALAYLHSRSPPILHNDLKSPNILVNDKWHVKLCDFGLARYKGMELTQAALGSTVAGTPAWMPPEVLLGDQFADEASDIFSYGVLLWELMTGKEPWAGYSRGQVVAAVAFQNQRLEIPEDANPILANVVRSCWLPASKRPTCLQVLAQLETHRVPRRTASMGASPRCLGGGGLSREPSMDLSDLPPDC